MKPPVRDEWGVLTYEFGDTEPVAFSSGLIDLTIYAQITLRWCNGRLVLTAGRYDYELTPEQLAQFREALKETEVLKK